MLHLIENEFKGHLEVCSKSFESLPTKIESISKLLLGCFENINNTNNKILIIGNGGSAADAQHFAAELTNRYKVERRALAAIALTTDSSALTSIANDFDYNQVFSRQIDALANENDIVFAISTSGNSHNIINALKSAQRLKCKTIGLSGNDGGKMAQYCDDIITIPSNDTPRIQEMHILVIHTLCEIIDNNFKENK